MAEQIDKVYEQVLKLNPVERAELIEKIFSSFLQPGENTFDEEWRAEAEERVDAYLAGHMTTKTAEEVFDSIQRDKNVE